MEEKKKTSRGYIYVNEGNYGEYLSGAIEINGVLHKFVAFKNEHKKESKHPDYRIPVEKKENAEAKPSIKPLSKEIHKTMTEDDIPF